MIREPLGKLLRRLGVFCFYILGIPFTLFFIYAGLALWLPLPTDGNVMLSIVQRTLVLAGVLAGLGLILSGTGEMLLRRHRGHPIITGAFFVRYPKNIDGPTEYKLRGPSMFKS